MVAGRFFHCCALAVLLPYGQAAVGWTTLTIDGRDVDAYVPSCASAGAPLILSLHAWATGKNMMKGVDRLVDYQGSEMCAIVVYPQGKVRGALFGAVGWSWNAGGCCPDANAPRADDVQFLMNVVSTVATELNGSEEEVFAIGISNGGMMANRLACADKRIKAFVSVSGPLVNKTDDIPGGESFQCLRQVPVLHFHGTGDTVVPYEGCNRTSGSSVCKALMSTVVSDSLSPFPAVPDYIADWRIRNGIIDQTQGASTFENHTASCMAWGGQSNNVTLCTLQGEGHAWPGTCGPYPILGRTPMFHCTYDIDASKEAMAFFRRYMTSTSGIVV